MADFDTEKDGTTKALSVDATDINTQYSTDEQIDLANVANEVHEEETKMSSPSTTNESPEKHEEKEKELQLAANLSGAFSVFESEEAKKFQIHGKTFRDNWQEFVKQPSIKAKVTTHDKDTEEVIYFANPIAPRRIYVGLKIKRISDVDNVRETYRCRFHIYFNWLLTKEGYLSYIEYKKNRGSKKVEWYPPFRPRYEFLNIVEAHLYEEVDYGIDGPYRVQRIKDFASELVGFDAEHAFMCRMKLEVDATFCEELELENFPVDCQDFSIVMREGWGINIALFIPSLRTKKGDPKGVPSDFARVDPSFSVLDEWEFHNSRIEFRSSNPNESRSDTEYFMLTIRFKMRRRYAVYLWNVVLYMFFITLMSLSCFALGDVAIVGERMSLAVTLLLTAVAFQDIVFEELPNVAYLTLLHKYIIVSFMFISGVSLQTACTAIQTVPWFSDEGLFDYPISFAAFVFVFISYNLIFMIHAGWLRHWESKKLYMDSHQLEEYIEERKHQFKMAWFAKPTREDFRGVNGRIASFVDVDPLMEMQHIKANNFCTFMCKWIGMGIVACLKCRCCQCTKKSDARLKSNSQRGTLVEEGLKELATSATMLKT